MEDCVCSYSGVHSYVIERSMATENTGVDRLIKCESFADPIGISLC